mgnify:CR=1 FL=1
MHIPVKNKTVLFQSEEIDRKVNEISRKILDYKLEHHVYIVFTVILKGGFKVASQIMKNFDLMGYDYSVTFVNAKSYYNDTSPDKNELKISFLDNIVEEFKDQTFVIIDDVLDTGSTMFGVKESLSSVTDKIVTCVLVDKPFRRKADITADISGFTVDEDHFLVGYGMGLGETYRSDPFISVLELEK